jgi:acetylornithine aminotransferase
VREVRGRGLLLAVVLTRPVAADVAARALDAGFIVNPVAPDAIRMAPPLILTEDQARDAARFFATLTDVVGTTKPTTTTDTKPTTMTDKDAD